eukprot:1648515-Pyramimonas_sp.AAC.1
MDARRGDVFLSLLFATLSTKVIERIYSHDGSIGRRKHGDILTSDPSDAESTGTFSRRTNQTQKARAYSHDGPIRRGSSGPPVVR